MESPYSNRRWTFRKHFRCSRMRNYRQFDIFTERHTMHAVAALLVLTLVGSSIAGPINVARSDECSASCTDSNNFLYLPGIVYEYRYDGSVLTKINGIGSESSGLQITANVNIEVFTKCALLLRLTNVVLQETDPLTGQKSPSPGADSFRQSLQQYPLRFSFQDGGIDVVCPVEQEKEWVTNIKRGILSALQNTMPNLRQDATVEETDVSGKCVAQYVASTSSWGNHVVTKTKDLTACTGRNGFRTSLQSTPYRVASDIQSLPLLKSTHVCEQTIDSNRVLVKSVCREEHVFRPFSRGNNGVLTQTSHMLNFVREREGISGPSVEPLRRSDLLFHHDDVTAAKDFHGSVSVLQRICRHTTHDVRPETPKLFSDLVYRLKSLDVAMLKSLHGRVTGNDVCESNHELAKKYFNHALIMTGTSAAVNVMSELLRRHYVVGTEADMWLSSLALVQHPTQSMIDSVKVLLEPDVASRTAYLSVTVLVHNYCQRAGSRCRDDPAVRFITALLERNLNANCRVQNDDQERARVLVSLKALGNIGDCPSAVPILNQCMTERSNSIPIRLAAIEALRRQPCSTNNQVLSDLLSYSNEDVEVRIAAYLAMMQCASRETIDQVHQVLEREEVNQVGSFIWTHLTNLAETADPHKTEIRKILEHQRLKKEFDLDKRKFSRNIEGSVFFDSINVGAKIESNLVWSPKSFIPRSAMLNLTVDLFGQSVNLLEFGGRVEGMEKLLETFFGPEGYFPDNALSREIRKTQRTFSQQRMDEKDRQRKDAVGNNKMAGSVYFKVFGNEIHYTELQDLMKRTDGLNILDILQALAQERELDYSKSLMFMDTDLTIPTILGLPLKLSVNGTATVNLKVKGKIDLRQLAAAPRNVDIDGRIKPSAAVEVSSVLGVDAFVTRSGLKMVTTLHSSTEINGKIRLQDGQILLANINMADENMEVLNANNKFFIIHRNADVKASSKVGTPVTKRVCTGETGAKVLGVELCGDVQYVNTLGIAETPLFPLTGPASFNVRLHKRDTHNSYTMEARLEKRQTRTRGQQEVAHVYRMAFNTPGSQVDREISIDLKVRPNARHVSLDLISPWKRANFNGAIQNEADLKKVELMLTVDNTDRYGLTSQVTIGRKQGRVTFSPITELHVAGRQPIILAGTVDLVQGRKMDVDLRVENMLDNPMSIKGTVERDVKNEQRSRLSADLEVKTPWMNSKVKGYVENKLDTYKSHVQLDYQVKNSANHQLVANYKIRSIKSDTIRSINANIGLRSTQFPVLDFQALVEGQRGPRHLESIVKVNYGDATNLQTLETGLILKYDRPEADAIKVDGSVKLQITQLKINSEMKFEHRHAPRYLRTKLDINYSPSNTVGFGVDLKNIGRELTHVTGDVSAHWPGSRYSMNHQVEELEPSEYHHKMLVTWGQDRQIESTTVLKASPGNDYAVRSTLKLPDMAPVSVSLSARLDPWNFRAETELNYNQRRYSARADYVLNLQSGQLTFVKNFDLNVPERHVIVRVRASRLGQELRADMSTKWDADRDASKEASFVGFYRIKHDRLSRTHEGDLRVACMGRSYEVSVGSKKTNNVYLYTTMMKSGANFFNLKSVLDLSDVLSAKVEMKSSCRRFPEAMVLLNLRGNDTRFNHDLQLQWNLDKKISLNVVADVTDPDNFHVIAKLETPFPEYTLVSFNIAHNIQRDLIRSRLSASINDKTMTATANGLANRLGAEMELKFVAPFLENPVVGKAGFEIQTGSVNAKLVLKTAGEEISTILNFRPEWKNFFAKLQVVTPFQKLRKFGVDLRNVMDDSEISGTANFELNERKAGFSLVGRNKNSFGNVEVTTKISIPIAGYHDLGFIVRWDLEESRTAAVLDLAWSPQQRYGFSALADHRDNLCKGKITVTVPFRPETHYEWNHESLPMLTSQHKVHFDGEDYTVNIQLEHLNSEHTKQYDWNVAVKTPVSWLNGAFVNSIIRSVGHNQLKSTLTYHNEPVYSASMEWIGTSLDDSSVEITMATNAIWASNAPITLSLLGQTRQAPYSIRLELTHGEKRIVSNVAMKISSLKDLEISIKVKTPFDRLRNGQIRFTNTMDNDNVATAALLTYNSENYEASFVSNKQNTDSNNALEGILTIKTPNREPITVSLKHTAEGNHYTTSADAMYDGRRQASMAFTMTHKRQDWMVQNRGSLSLTLPVQAYRSTSYKWYHNNDRNGFVSNHQVALLDKSATFNVDGTFQKTEDGVTIAGKLLAEVPQGRVDALFNHECGRANMKSEINVKTNRVNLLNLRILGSKDAGKFQSNVQLEIKDMHPITAMYKLNKNGPVKGQLEVNWAGNKRFKVNTRINSFNWRNADASISINTPVREWETITASVKQTVNTQQFKHSSSVEYNGAKRIAVEALWETTANARRMFSITSPFSKLRSFVVDADKTALKVEFEGAETFKTEARYSSNDFKLKLISTFEQISDFEVSYKKESNGVILQAKRDQKQIVKFISRIDDNVLISIQTPFNAMRELLLKSTPVSVEMKFDGFRYVNLMVHLHSMTAQRIHTKIQLEATNMEDIHGEFLWERTSSSATHHLKLTGPWQISQNGSVDWSDGLRARFACDYYGYSLSTHMNLNRNEGNAALEMKANRINIVNGDLIYSNADRSLDLNLNTKYDAAKQLSVVYRNRNLNVNFNGYQQAAIQGEFVEQPESKMRGNFVFTSTVSGYERIDFTVDHQCNMDLACGALIVLNTQSGMASIKGHYDAQTRQATLNIQTPYQSFRTLALTASRREFNVTLNNEHTLSLSYVLHSLAWNNIHGSLKLTSSMESLRDLEGTVYIRHENFQRGSNEITLRSGLNRFILGGNYNLAARKVDLSVTSPYDVMRSFAIKASQEELKIMFDGFEHAILTIKFHEFNVNEIAVTTKIRSSFQLLKKFDSNLQIRHDKLMRGSGEMRVSINDAAMAVSGQYDLTDLEAKTTLTTPFENLKTLSTSISRHGLEIDITGTRTIKIIAKIDSLTMSSIKTHLEITSDQRGFESFESKIAFQRDSLFSGKGQLMIRKNEASVTINTEYDLSQMEALVTMSTTFNMIRTARLKVSPKSVDLRLNENDRITISGDVEQLSLAKTKASIALRTSIPGYENFESSFESKWENKKLVQKFHIGSSPSKGLALNAIIDFNDKLSGEFTMRTPSGRVHRAQVSALVTTSSAEVTMMLNEKRITATANVEELSFFSTRGRMRLETPFDMCKDISLEIAHSINTDSNRLSTKATFTINGQAKVLQLEVDANKNDINISTPFKILRNFQARRTSRSYGTDVMVSADSDVFPVILSWQAERPDSFNYQVKLNAQLPITGFEQFDVTYKYKHHQNRKTVEWVSNLPSGTSKVRFSVQTQSPYIFDFDVRTPYNPLKVFRVKMEHDGEGLRYTNKIDFEYVAYIARVKINNEFSVQSLDRIRGSTRIITPIMYAEMINLDMTHERQGSDYISTLAIEYEPRTFIRLNSKVNKNSVDVTLTSPIELLKKVHFGFDLTGTTGSSNERTAKIEFVHNEAELLKIEVAMNGFEQVRVLVNLHSSVFSWGSTSVELNHSIQGKNLQESAVLTYGAKVAKISVVSKLDDEKMETDVKIETPWTFLRKYEGKKYLQQVGNAFDFKEKAHYEGFERVIHYSVELGVNPSMNLITAKAMFSKDGNLYEANFKNEINDGAYGTVLETRTPRCHMALNNSVTIVGENFIADTTFTSSGFVKKMAFKLNQNGLSLIFRNRASLNLQTSAGDISIEQRIDTDFPSFMAYLDLKTPSVRMSSFRFAMSHIIDDVKAVSVAASLNGQEASVVVKYNTNSRVNLDLTVKTPFECCKDISLKFDLSGQSDAFKVKSTLKHSLMETPIRIDMMHNFQRELNSRFRLTSPFHEPLAIEMLQRSPDAKRSYQLSLTLGNVKCSLAADVEFLSVNDFSGSVNLQTLSQTKYELRFRHALREGNVESTAVLTTELNQIADLRLSYQPNQRDQLSVTGSMDTIWTGPASMTITISKESTTRTVYVDLGKSEKRITLTGSVNYNSIEDFSVKAELQNPSEFRTKLIISNSGERKMNSHIRVEAPYAMFPTEVRFSWETQPTVKVHISLDAATIDTIAVDLSFDKHLNVYKAASAITQGQDTIVSLKSMLKFESWNEASANLNLSYRSHKSSFSFDHKRDENTLKCSIGASLPVYGTYGISVQAERSDKLSAEVKVTIPEFDLIVATFSHENGETRLKSYAGAQEHISLKCNSDLKSLEDFRADVELALGWDYGTGKLNVNHKGNLRAMKSSLALEWMGENAQFNIVHKLIDSPLMVDTRLSMITTFTEPSALRFVLNNDGGFKIDARANYGVKVVESTVNFNYLPAVNSARMDVKIRSPVPYLEDVTVSMSHDGGLSAFTNKIGFTSVNGGAYKMETNVGYRNAQLKVETPLSGWELTEVKMRCGKTGNRYTAAIDILGDKKVMKLSYDVNNEDYQKSVAVELTTPIAGIERLSATATFEKEEVKSYIGKVSVSNGFDQYVFQTKLKMLPRTVHVLVSAQTPVESWRNFGATLAVSVDDTKLVAEISGTNMDTKVESTLLIARNLRSASLEVKTPFSNWKQGKIMYDLIDNKLSVRANKGLKTVTFDGEFQIEPVYKASIAVRTPLEGFEFLSASAKYRKNDGVLSGGVKVQYGTGKEIEADAMLNYADMAALQLQAALKTPFDYVQSAKVTGSYRIVNNDVSGNVVLQLEDKILESEFSLLTSPKFVLSAKLKTPFTSMEHQTMNIQWRGSKNRFTTEAAVNLFNQEYKGSVEFTNQNLRHIVINSKLSTPIRGRESYTMSFIHNGDWENMRTQLSVFERNNQIVDVEVLHNEGRGLLRLYTPVVNATIEHRGQVNNCSSSATISLWNGVRMSADKKFSLSPLLAELNIDVPQYLTAEFSLTGRILDLKGRANVKYLNHEYHLLSELSDVDGISGTILIRTPHSVVRHAHLRFGHTGGLDIHNMRTNVEFNHNHRRLFEASHHRHHRGGNLRMETALIKMTIHHNGPWQDCTTNFEFLLHDGTQITAEQKFVLSPLEAKLNIRVPDKMSIELYHKGTYNNFKSSVNNVYYNRQYKGEMEFRFEHGLNVKFFIQTPFANFEHLKVEGNYKADLEKFISGGMVQWTPEDKIAVRLDMQLGENIIESDLNIVTPITEDLKVKVIHQRTGVIKASMEAKYGNRLVELTGSCDRNAESSLTLKTPFRYLENVAVSTRRIRISNTNGYQVQIQLSPGRNIVTDVAGDIYSETKTGYLKLTTPFSEFQHVTVNGEHLMTNSALKQKINVVVDSRPIWDSAVDITINDGRVNGEVVLKSPRAMKYTLQILNVEKQKSVELNLDWDAATRASNVYIKAEHLDNSAYYRVMQNNSLIVALPWRTMALKYSREHSRLKTNHVMELAWNQHLRQRAVMHLGYVDESRSYQNAYTVFGTLVTPIRSMKTSYQHVSSSAVYQGVWKTLWDLERYPEKVLEVSSSYKLQGETHLVGMTVSHPRLAQPIAIRNEFHFNTRDIIYGGKTEVVYSNDPADKFVLISNVNDDSHGRRENISLSVHVTHPKTLVAVKLNAHAGNSASAASTGLNVNYLSAHRQKQTFALFGQIEKLKRSMNMKMQTMNTEMDLVGWLQTRDNGYDVYWTAQKNQGNPLRSVLNINTDKRSFTLDSRYDFDEPEKTIHASGYFNKTAIHMRVHRVVDGMHIKDGLFSVHLNNSRVLRSVLRWRPENAGEILAAANAVRTNVQTSVNEFMNNAIIMVNDEMSERLSIMKSALPETEDAIQYVNDELDGFRRDYARMAAEVQRMRARNEFYCRDIEETMEKVGNFISERATYLTYRLRTTLVDMDRALRARLSAVRRTLDQLASRLEETIAGLVLKFRPAWQSYAYAAYRQAQVANMAVRHGAELLGERLGQHKADIYQYLDARFDHLTYKVEHLLNKFFHFQEQARFYLLSEKQKTYLDNLRVRVMDSFRLLVNEIQIIKQDAVNKGSQLFERVKRIVAEKIDQNWGHDYAVAFSNMANDLVNELKQTYDNWEVNGELKGLLINTLDSLSSQVRRSARKLMQSYMRVGNTGFKVYNPENGHIELDAFLPLDVESFDVMPKINVEAWKNELNEIKARYLPKSSFNLWDTYYKYKPSSDVADWIPPFKAHASVLLGGSRFITFDGRHYSFVGTCSYVLAKFFDASGFAIVANYRRGQIDSFNIVSDGKELTMQMVPEFNMKLDNVGVEAPLSYANTSVLRHYDLVTVRNKRGMVFECGLRRQICTLYISGWLHNKVGGLFGTYDNEPINDFSTPSLTTVDDVDRFAESWNVGKSCQHAPGASSPSRPLRQPSNQTIQACQALFESRDSPLAHGFSSVSPRPFYEMCLNHPENEEMGGNQVICTIVHAYIQKCRILGISMSYPDMCNGCEDDRVRVHESREWRPSSASVLFVFEERQCNRQLVDKLGIIAMTIKNALQANDINPRDSKFGLLGYGGDGDHRAPHSHSVKGQLFGSAETLRLAAANLEISTSDQAQDVFEALKIAARYPFPDGVSRIIVLIPCSQCAHSATPAPDMERLLQERGIALHVLQAEQLVVDENMSRHTEVIGLDSNTAFTATVKDEFYFASADDIYPASTPSAIPRQSACARMAIRNHGSAFSAMMMGRERNDQRFINVLARRVAVPGPRPPAPSRQACKCISDENGNGRTHCAPDPLLASELLDLARRQPPQPTLLGHRGENPTMNGFIARPIARPQQVSHQD